MISIIILVAYYIGLGMCFKKMGREFWEGILPVYNMYVLYYELYGNGWRFLTLLIPFYNIYVMVKAGLDLAEAFHQKTALGIGLAFLPCVFYPVLGFGEYVYLDGTAEGYEKKDFNSFRRSNSGHPQEQEKTQKLTVPAKPCRCAYCGYVADTPAKICPNCGVPFHN